MSHHRTRHLLPAGSDARLRTGPRHHRRDQRTGNSRRAMLRSDRGDVPGWVMITLMTAAIVVVLWAVASEQLVAIFNNAMAPFLNHQP